MKETILEIKHKVLKFLLTNSYINPREHLKELEIDSKDDDEFLEKVIISILNDLQEAKIVRKVETSKQNNWVLEKPLVCYDQNILLNYELCFEIADVINEYTNYKNPVDASNITQSEIQKLILILESVLDSKKS